MWRIDIEATEDTREAIEAALEPLADAVSSARDDAGWRVTGLTPTEPAPEEIARALSATGIGAAPDFGIARLPERDWIAVGLAGLSPITAGRIHVRGSHSPPPPRSGSIDLVVEAGRAFGSGHHATTLGCLLALDGLARHARFHRPLDMGCGSGVLAMAMARLWRVPVLAADIDPQAVAVTRANARLNRLGNLVQAVRADSFKRRPLVGRRFDLIAANILSGPLIAMAGDMARCREHDGPVVLSGLLWRQSRSVVSAYRRFGMVPVRSIVIDGWSTLVLR